MKGNTNSATGRVTDSLTVSADNPDGWLYLQDTNHRAHAYDDGNGKRIQVWTINPTGDVYAMFEIKANNDGTVETFLQKRKASDATYLGGGRLQLDNNTMYRASISDGQHLDTAWVQKNLTCTQRENRDSSTFTAHTNGVTLNRAGLYIISTGLAFRGGSAGVEMILGLRHIRGSNTLTSQNIRCNNDDYDSGCSQTMFIYAEANDRIVVTLNGTSTSIVTQFAPDESYLNVIYLGGGRI